jgi:hypothetical protein
VQNVETFRGTDRYTPTKPLNQKDPDFNPKDYSNLSMLAMKLNGGKTTGGQTP